MTHSHLPARDAFVARHPEVRHVINGRDWGAIRTGDSGPALVLIPGTLGRADIFWQQIEALDGRVRILALSYPASGGIADWAEDVAGLIKAQNLEGAVVLGSSLGGYLAQYLTATQPDLVSGLVAANTLASVTGIEQMPPYSLDLIQTPIDVLRAGFSTGLATWTTPDHPNAPLAELLLQEVADRIPEAELRARLNALKTGPEIPRQQLSAEAIHIVESGDDHLISPPMQAALRGALPGSRCFHLIWGSHFPYVTRPMEYTALLEEVLNLAPTTALTWPTGQDARL